jgi:RNA polymerase sigma factor (sigma-70 family)
MAGRGAATGARAAVGLSIFSLNAAVLPDGPGPADRVRGVGGAGFPGQVYHAMPRHALDSKGCCHSMPGAANRCSPSLSLLRCGDYVMRDDPVVVALVARAVGGDQAAWDEIVERYAPLVWSISNRYRLSSQDIEDVGQNVWLLLIEQLGNLHEPAALPGWLATTTHRECLRVLRTSRRNLRLWPALDDLPLPCGEAAIEQDIIVAERNAALRAAFAELPDRCRELLSMLISDPPYSYAEISDILQIPVGSIGPQRARCLNRLRRANSLAPLMDGAIAGSPVRSAGGERRA